MGVGRHCLEAPRRAVERFDSKWDDASTGHGQPSHGSGRPKQPKGKQYRLCTCLLSYQYVLGMGGVWEGWLGVWWGANIGER